MSDSGWICRDPYEMINYADEIELSIKTIRRLCEEMLNILYESSSKMQDDFSKKEIQKIKMVLYQILYDTTPASEVAVKLRDSGKILKKARSL